MPQLGHGIVGLAMGAATAGDPRSHRLRSAWPGVLVLLACLPDVAEWIVRLVGWRIPHSAPASLLALAVYCLVACAVLVLLCSERRPVVLIVAVLALCSHTALDFMDGGVPLAWPFSAEYSGGGWLPLEMVSFAGRTQVELLIFLPILALGVAVGVGRNVPGHLALGLVVVLAVAVGGACVAGSALVAAGGAAILLATAIVLIRRKLRWACLWSLVPLTPVLLVGAAELYARDQVRRGIECERRGEIELALAHHLRAVRLRPLGAETHALYRAAHCYRLAGKDEQAYEVYTTALAENPHNFLLCIGLSDLYLESPKPSLQRPREALRLAERVLAHTDWPYYVKKGHELQERAREAIGQSEGDQPGGRCVP